jgi:hypothetical protein
MFPWTVPRRRDVPLPGIYDYGTRCRYYPLERHREIKLRPLCEKVCHNEMTRQEAVHQFRPKWIVK